MSGNIVSDRVGGKKIVFFFSLFALAMILGYLVTSQGLIAIVGVSVLPFVIAAVLLVLYKPEFGVILCMFIGLTVLGITRYIDAPLGLSLDLAILLTLVAALFKQSRQDLKLLNNPAVWAVGGWTLYTIFELFNPEAISSAAWFFAVRAISFYFLFLIVITFLAFRKLAHLNIFIQIWLIGAVISSLYGMKQLYIGLNGAELRWLQEPGAADTHILFGRLRVFSFYSDAGQFGAFMAYSSLIAAVLALKAETMKLKIWYACAAGIIFWGMAISGTRGAMFVFTGLFFYLLLTKNFRVLFVGIVMAGAVFFLLRFTYIGQSNYQIQRMRSAVNPTEDLSFQARLENQRKLKGYLASRPFGGGVGTIGYWGKRFSPNTFLANTPPDSYFVRIWAETGIVGLVLHVLCFVYLLIKGFMIIFKLKDPYLKQKMMAFYSGMFGVLLASYGNQVVSQMPTVVFFSISTAFIFYSPHWDKQIERLKQIKVRSL